MKEKNPKTDLSLKVTNKNLFQLHAEFNTICGMVIAVLDKAKRSGTIKEDNIEKCYPEFCKMLNIINKEMQKYAIT